MKNVPKSSVGPLQTGLVFAAMVSSFPLSAGPLGYVVDSSGKVVRNNYGECIHTASWKPELGIEECGEKPATVTQTPVEQPTPPAPPPEKITLDAETLFAFDKATLRPEARATLDELATRITRQTKVLFIRVTGHADRIGSAEYNENLSRERANAVTEYLQKHTDLRDSKFQVQGMGETQPVVECKDSDSTADLIKCLAPNRRVEIEVSLQQPAETP